MTPPSHSTLGQDADLIAEIATRIWQICKGDGIADPGTDHERIVREINRLKSRQPHVTLTPSETYSITYARKRAALGNFTPHQDHHLDIIKKLQQDNQTLLAIFDRLCLTKAEPQK